MKKPGLIVAKTLTLARLLVASTCRRNTDADMSEVESCLLGIPEWLTIDGCHVIGTIDLQALFWDWGGGHPKVTFLMTRFFRLKYHDLSGCEINEIYTFVTGNVKSVDSGSVTNF